MKKSMFVLAMLILASSYSFADDEIKVGNKAKIDTTLQSRAFAPEKGYAFQVGDTIVISKNTKHYLTGEEPSTWVYYVRHIIQQIGGKRFPNGIFVKGIISWIGPEDALLVGSQKETPASQERKIEDKPQVQKQQKELDQKTPAEKREISDKAGEIGTEPLHPIADKKPQKDNGPIVADQTEQKPEPKLEPEKKPEQKPEKEPVAPTDEQPVVVDDALTEPIGKDSIGEVDRFTIGLRGGAASLLQKTSNANSKSTFGGDVLLDLQYAHYWQTRQTDHLFGLLVGLSAGYAQGGLKSTVNDTYTKFNPDNGTEKVTYTVKADKVMEDNRQIQLEVPIMFSMVMNNGFFLNAGPRLMIPVYTPYSGKVTEPSITAHFEDWGVTVDNALATGKVTEEMEKFKGSSANAMKINVMLGLELGYEWRLKHGNSLGLGAYANYGIYNAFKQNTLDKSIIDVTPAVPTKVEINSATNTYTNGMGYLDAGLKVAYHFNWWKWNYLR